jgi:hypothetical protein
LGFTTVCRPASQFRAAWQAFEDPTGFMGRLKFDTHFVSDGDARFPGFLVKKIGANATKTR